MKFNNNHLSRLQYYDILLAFYAMRVENLTVPLCPFETRQFIAISAVVKVSNIL